MRQRSSTRSLFARAIAAAAIIASALAWTTRPISASHVNCGDTITTNTILDSDLLNCAGDGIVIGAPNITLNLNGHTVSGSATGFGINDLAGHDRITVQNGSVQGFFVGVALSGARDSRLVDLSVNANGAGIFLAFDSDKNRIERCDVTGNSTGIFVQSGSDQNEITRNRIENNSVGGLAIDGADDNKVRDNDVNNNAGGGIFLTGGADRNRVEKNDLKNNGIPAGIYVDASADNVLLKNDLEKNADGIFVSASATGTIIERNDSSKNTFDGIDVDSTSAEITMNVTNKNGDLGIEAVPGVTDGGGNKAKGNTNPLQCTGVSCS
jgi:parallel beta-helix repeat protein